MQSMRLAAYRQANFLQPIDPLGSFALGHVGPFVEFLRQYLCDAKKSDEESDSGPGNPVNQGHGNHSKRNAKFVHVVAKTSLGDGPGCRVVPLKRGNDATHNGCFAISIIVDAPVQDTRAEIGQ